MPNRHRFRVRLNRENLPMRGDFMKYRTMIAVVTALLLNASVAHAYGDGGWGISGDTINDLIQSQMSYRSVTTLQDAVRPDNDHKKTPVNKKSPLDSAKEKSPLDSGNESISGNSFVKVHGIEKLASLYPREEFLRRKIMFEKIILSFNQSVEKLYGVPKNNLATGMAAALAGGYAAYTNTTFPDDKVKPLVEQLDYVMRDDPKILEASHQSKAYWYQLMVGLGMALQIQQVELQKNPDPSEVAKLKKAGGDFLQAILKVDPSRVSVTSSGMKIR